MLRFGYNQGLPAGTDAAWGCRAIIDQSGTVDMVHDQQDAIGPDQPRRALAAGRATSERRHNGHRLAEEFVLYEDTHVVVEGKTQGSGGYLYVCAYLEVTR